MDSSSFQFEGPKEIYADAVRLNASPYSFTFDFGVQTSNPDGVQTQAIIRMSPQHTLVFYQILKNYLREYQDKIGIIGLPDALFSELKIEKDI